MNARAVQFELLSPKDLYQVSSILFDLFSTPNVVLQYLISLFSA